MHPAEIKFIEVSKRFAVVGLQAAQAYNAEQAKLQLEQVLSPDRLSSTEGTQVFSGQFVEPGAPDRRAQRHFQQGHRRLCERAQRRSR